MSVLKWLSNVAQTAIDPNRDGRVKQLESFIVAGLKSHGRNFSIKQVKLTPEFSQADLDDAAERVFLNFLGRVWDDNVITKKEKAQLAMLELSLELEPSKIKSMQMTFAKDAFEAVLAESMEDGAIDDNEKKHLTHIAAQLGCSLGAFVKAYFRDECEGFLRSVFLAAINDGDLSTAEWNNLVATIETLGLSREEFFERVQPQAQAFVEHVLADAKADENLSTAEEEKLVWLMKNLELPTDYLRYVNREIAQIKLLEKIEQGVLPTIKAPSGLETVGGELVHAKARCDLHHVRNLKSGPRTTVHSGSLIVTDRKTVFVSETKSFRIGYRSILGHRGNEQVIGLQAQGKPEMYLELQKPDATIYAIFKTALAIANQTKMSKVDGRPSRHISRDVRQTVWQRYGGRCADCNANDYLEFDHIIPVAKGGSNSESNIQLLCRRCNNKKSDKI